MTKASGVGCWQCWDVSTQCIVLNQRYDTRQIWYLAGLADQKLSISYTVIRTMYRGEPREPVLVWELVPLPICLLQSWFLGFGLQSLANIAVRSALSE